MIRRPPRSTRTDTLFPYTTLFRSTAQILDPSTVALLGLGEAGTALARGLVEQSGWRRAPGDNGRSEEHTSETPVTNAHLVCRLLLEKKKTTKCTTTKL